MYILGGFDGRRLNDMCLRQSHAALLHLLRALAAMQDDARLGVALRGIVFCFGRNPSYNVVRNNSLSRQGRVKTRAREH